MTWGDKLRLFIGDEPGQVPIDEVAKRLGCSPSYVRQQFQRAYPSTPKHVVRMARALAVPTKILMHEVGDVFDALRDEAHVRKSRSVRRKSS